MVKYIPFFPFLKRRHIKVGVVTYVLRPNCHEGVDCEISKVKEKNDKKYYLVVFEEQESTYII